MIDLGWIFRYLALRLEIAIISGSYIIEKIWEVI